MAASSPLQKLTEMVSKAAGEPPSPAPEAGEATKGGPDALKRLSVMVQAATARTRFGQTQKEMAEVTQRLRTAEERLALVRKRIETEKPTRQAALDQVGKEEDQLKKLVKEIAALRQHLTKPEQAEFDTQIEAARSDLTARRKEAETALTEIAREFTEASTEVKTISARYADLRAQIAQVDASKLSDLRDTDAILAALERMNPTFQLQSLLREIGDDGMIAQYESLPQPQRFEQLRIWVGRARRVQDQFRDSLGEDDVAMLQRIFPRLTWISGEYRPGYIEAMERNYDIGKSEFRTWDAYIEDAQRMLQRAMEDARNRRPTVPLRGGR